MNENIKLLGDARFKKIDPLLSFDPPHQQPWVRVATNEGKSAGTFVHIGYKGDQNEAVLTYETAAELYRWLGEALGIFSIKEAFRARYITHMIKAGVDVRFAAETYEASEPWQLDDCTPEDAAQNAMDCWTDDGDSEQ